MAVLLNTYSFPFNCIVFYSYLE